MPFVTRQQISTASRRLDAGSVRLAKSLTGKDVFLSHSQYDSDLLVGALGVLDGAGASVYADVLDPSLGALSMDGKVQQVRDAVARCKRLVVLFSKNASTSKWIPWELGLADGNHGLSNVATFPVGDDSSEASWGTQEYFGVYPQIRAAGPRNDDFVVRFPQGGKQVSLRDWLRSAGGLHG
jgi:hypothetical protein